MATTLEQEFTVDYLEPEHINLFTNPNGIVCMEYKGTVYWKLSARRALPHQNREEYIFLYNYSDSEIGAIKALHDLPREQRDIVNELLDKRYFTREIKSIYSIIDKFSVLIFKVKTDLKEEVEFTMKALREAEKPKEPKPAKAKAKAKAAAVPAPA